MKSKLAITSFILTLIGSLLLISSLLLIIPQLMVLLPIALFLSPFLSLSPLLLLAGLIMAIISLVKIKKYNLQGRGFAWVSIIIFVLTIIFFIISLGVAPSHPFL